MLEEGNVANSIRTNLHLIYVIDNRKCFYFTDETCPDFYSILSGLDLENTTILLLPPNGFQTRRIITFYDFIEISENSYFHFVVYIVMQFINVTQKKIKC